MKRQLLWLVMILFTFSAYSQEESEKTPEKAEAEKTIPVVMWKKAPAQFVSQLVSVPVAMEHKSAINEIYLKTEPQIDSSWVFHWQESLEGRLFWQPLKEGKYKLTIEVRDQKGNIGVSESHEVYYDTTPPEADLTVPEKDYFHEPVPIVINADDAVSGLKKVTLVMPDKKEIEADAEGNSYKVTLDFAQSGSFVVKALICDKAGNQQVLTQTIAIDKGKPSVQSSTSFPLYLSKTGKLDLKMYDDFSQIAQLQVNMGEKQVIQKKSPALDEQISWQVKDFSEGEYPLEVMVIDRAGNSTRKVLGQAIIDKTAPVVEPLGKEFSVSEGITKLNITFDDKGAGIDLQSKVQIFLKLRGKKYPFQLDSFEEKNCRAQLSITQNYPKEKGKIFISGLQDRAGNKLPETFLGNMNIRAASLIGKWPLEPRDQGHAVYDVYSRKSVRENSPIWLEAKSGQKIMAIAYGKIVELTSSNKQVPGYMRIEQPGGQWVWGYHNIIVGNNPASGKLWAAGDLVAEGDLLGQVAKLEQEDSQSYLYLEVVQWKNGQWHFVASPLKYLSPQLSQRVSPKILLQTRRMTKNRPSPLNFAVSWAQYREPGKNNFSDKLLLAYIMFAIIAIITLVVSTRPPRFSGE